MEDALYKLHAEVELAHWWFVARRRIMTRLLHRVMPPFQDRWVVEVGCGTGANTAALHAHYRVTGTDTHAEAIELARSRFSGVDFRLGLAPEIFEGEKPNAILLLDVLEHVEADGTLLESLCASLAPGGVILITVPADMALWSPHDEHFGHYRRYDKMSLRRLWAGLPLRERLFSPMNYRLYPPIRAVRTIGAKLGRGVGSGGSDLKMPSRQINRLFQRIFEREADQLEHAIDQPQAVPNRRGVSLVAILERIEDRADA